jgi:hypothetical protein
MTLLLLGHGRARVAPVPARGPQGPEFRGDLQAEVMAAVWRLGEATVEQVRELQPAERRSAYTTIQTVLNRLVDRGFLSRAKDGRKFVNRARADQVDIVVLGRPVPGTRAALRGLLLSLDRDADEFAVARTGDPLALASAICKVAGGSARRRARGLSFGVDGPGGTPARLAGGRRRGGPGRVAGGHGAAGRAVGGAELPSLRGGS